MAATEILAVIRAEEAVRKLTKAMAENREAIERIDLAYDQGLIKSKKEHARLVKDEAREIGRHTRALQRQQDILRRGERMNARHAGYAALYASSAVSQFGKGGGFSSAMRSIPPISMLMGASPQLAGAFSLAGVAGSALWDQRYAFRHAARGSSLEGTADFAINAPRIGRRAYELLWGQVPWLGLGTPDANQAMLEARDAQLRARIDQQRQSAVAQVEGFRRPGIGAMAGAGQMAIGHVFGGGEGLLEDIFTEKVKEDIRANQTQFDLLNRHIQNALIRTLGEDRAREAFGGLTDKAEARREEIRGNIARGIQGLLTGDGGDFFQNTKLGDSLQNAVAEELVKALQRGTQIASQDLKRVAHQFHNANEEVRKRIADALIPSEEADFRDQAQRSLKSVTLSFERAFQAVNFTLPGLTDQGRQQLGEQFTGQMAGAGVSPEMQAQIAALFSSKAGGRRAALLPVILPMLMQAGATEREVYEALPRIFDDIDNGMNVFSATQRAINELQRGGLAQQRQAARTTRQQRMAVAGLQMLGLDPEIDESQTSRFLRNRTGLQTFKPGPGAGLPVDVSRASATERSAWQDQALMGADIQAAARQRRMWKLRKDIQGGIQNLALQQEARRQAALEGRDVPGFTPIPVPTEAFGRMGVPWLPESGSQEAKPIREQIADAIAQVGGGPFSTAGLSAADRDKVALGMLPPIPKVNIWPGITDFQLWAQQDERRAEMARQGLFPGTTMQPQYEAAYRAAGTALQGGMLQGEWARKAEAIQQETIAQRERDAAIMDQLINNQAVMAQQLADLSRRSQSQERSARAIGQHLNQTGRSAQNRGR